MNENGSGPWKYSKTEQNSGVRDHYTASGQSTAPRTDVVDTAFMQLSENLKKVNFTELDKTEQEKLKLVSDKY